ncbi:hypothetical protein AVEN_227090-1 [Araneus ventricosus]|uniref:Uncharacterized protein n=1 Tax=Araneus ventricosus TaxID=182803 RepID=A0A4Y2BV72_ARAVE|nr:hypothetical protein AVEN_227090-1 [Araneus ventricosus]
MHSVTDCFHSNQPSLSILSSRRNLSAAKHGDLTDNTPSFPTRTTFFPYHFHPKHLSFTLERGVRGIGTGSPSEGNGPNPGRGIDLFLLAGQHLLVGHESGRSF